MEGSDREVFLKTSKKAKVTIRAERRSWTVGEFCLANRFGRNTFYNEVHAGRLKVFKIGRRTYVSREAAEDWALLVGASSLTP